MSKYQKNWKIDDPSFYPLGLFNKSSKLKTVFVAWSHECILTYIFKRTNNSSILTDSYKLNYDGVIKDIIFTNYNTLVLTESGKLYYFASCKNLKLIKTRGDEGTIITCVSSSENGFNLIRIDSNKNVHLECYEDFLDPGELRMKCRKYDITFDEKNIFNSEWKTQKFSLLSILITANNLRFLQVMTDQTVDTTATTSDESAGELVHFFSVGNHLFCLKSSFGKRRHSFINEANSSDDEYEISIVAILSSDVELMKYLDSARALLIFLSCGAIEILYHSRLLDGVGRLRHVMSSSWLSAGVNVKTISFGDNDTFFYSDLLQVIKCSLIYDESNDECSITEVNKNIPGIASLTWVRSIQILYCLSENNIFYKVKFPKSNNDQEIMETVTVDDENSNTLVILDRPKMKQIEDNLNRLLDIIEEPILIRDKIQLEHEKQQIMNLAKCGESLVNLISIKLNYHSRIPLSLNGKDQPIVLRPKSKEIGNDSRLENSYFVVVSVKISESYIFSKNIISYWTLALEMQSGNPTKSRNYVYNVPLSEYGKGLKNEFQILLILRKSDLFVGVLPKVSIYLNSCVTTGNDSIYISMPLQSFVDFKNLFTTRKDLSMLLAEKEENQSQNILLKLLENNFPLDYIERRTTLERKSFGLKIKTPLIMNFTELMRKEFLCSDKWQNSPIIIVDDEESYQSKNSLRMYFLGKELLFDYDENENNLELKSIDPGALFFAKLIIAKHLSGEFYDVETISMSAECLESIIKYKCEIENQRYGNDLVMQEYKNNLTKIYMKIRQDANIGFK